MFTFNKKYLILTIILFLIEVLIAVFVRDAFVRPYVGDYLVVILIYCAVRTVLKASVWKVAVGVLLFSFLIETLQYFHIVNRLGLENNVVARSVIGIGFEWMDFVAYTLGILTVLAFESKKLNQRIKERLCIIQS
ncbi:ribosomal maturation YjgA family protein [Flavisolibacter ginsengisoli]|jgi:hypothetical protein|uniref:DUF2809 domain-containing protein n=1 Tax=Flavisolibacter ginsengisoli DSM 18119 TaxID=1121884 RepID=A0A1M5CBB4_9BACT|nr:DUF2809 domain-containing protein [Flavisolibacter ginsengisoli]SHF51990.1 Protein of unknown function [Flavisolibacter ginsengisoli DSM 18119]